MTVGWSRVLALISNDFRIHGRDIALTQVGVIALLAFAVFLKPMSTSVNASLIFNFNVLLAGFWSEWLISREKTKGTLAWLRASAVSDLELVLAKFTTVAVCTITLWTVSSALLLPRLVLSRFDVWVVLQLSLLAFGACAVASRWRLGPKLGQLLPFIGLGAVLGVFVLLARTGALSALDPQVLLGYRAGAVVLGLVLATVHLVVFAVTLRWVRQSDTAALLE